MSFPHYNKPVPTLYEWLGGMSVIENLMNVFYTKVLNDSLLQPIFGNMSPDHKRHVAHFVAEVFGGPKIYSTEEGSHFKMIQKHFSRHLTEQHRKRWADLLIESSDEIHLPDDPEFRSAFVAYIEWGTRIAVLNSNSTGLNIHPDTPMPTWGWGETRGPYVG